MFAFIKEHSIEVFFLAPIFFGIALFFWLRRADDAEEREQDVAGHTAHAAASAWAVKFDARRDAIDCISIGPWRGGWRCTVEKDGRPLALDCTRSGCTLERCAP